MLYKKLGIGLLLLLLLSACGQPADQSAKVTLPSVSSDPKANLELDAEGNRETFDYANKVVYLRYAKEGMPSSKELADALIGAGFTKEMIQVTKNKTTLDADAYAISASVLVNGSCLIGQFTRATGEYISSVTKPIGSTGKCLLGDTAHIE